MAIDLTGLTETELTELLSSVSPYTKSEMIAWLKMNVEISSSWEKDDAAHTVTIHFTPIKDLRALKYLETHTIIQGTEGGNAVFFQLLRHGTRTSYDSEENGGVRYVIEAPSQQAIESDDSTQTQLEAVYVNGSTMRLSTMTAFAKRSKFNYGRHRASKHITMLYPQDLVATIVPTEYVPEGGTIEPAGAKISQYVKDGIDNGYYAGSYKGISGNDTSKCFDCFNAGTYRKVSRKATEKVTLSRVQEYKVALDVASAIVGKIALP